MLPLDPQDHKAPSPSPALADAPPASPRALSARTLHFYARDWAAFTTWCRSAGATPLPADAATLAAYLTAASVRLGPSAIARHLAAITDRHFRQGMLVPRKDPAVRAVLKTIQRAAAPRRDPPPSPALLTRMIAACPGDLAGLRDRALLLLMMATGLGRAALVSLDAENIRTTNAGCDFCMGEDGATANIRLTRNPDFGKCAVRAVEEWLRVSETSFGPVFRKIDRWGNIEHHRFGTDAVRRILTRRTPSRSRHGKQRGSATDVADLS